METISYTAAREKLAQIMDRVCENHTPYIITRQNNKPVVVMSLEDFRILDETISLLNNPANAEKLASAINKIKKESKAQLEKRHKDGYKKKPVQHGEFDVFEAEQAWPE
jgi:antitoxin YefM